MLLLGGDILGPYRKEQEGFHDRDSRADHPRVANPRPELVEGGD